MSGPSQERSPAEQLLGLAGDLEALATDRRALQGAFNSCLAAVRASHDRGDPAAADCDRLRDLDRDLRDVESRACSLLLRITALVEEASRG